MSRLFPGGLDYFVASVAALLAIVVMASLASLYVLDLLHKDSPSAVVPRLAALYLNALAVNDYATAYPMLTEASRLRCTLREFGDAHAADPWSWSGLTLAGLEPRLAAVDYDRIGADGSKSRRTIMFVKERGRWEIPYDDPALDRAGRALAKGQNELALIQAQQAFIVDPYDAEALTLVCAAERRLKLDQAEADCSSARELAKRYPRFPR